MKRLTLILMTLFLTGSSFAQLDIVQPIEEYRRKLWTISLFGPRHDDSHLRETIPLIFGPNGKYFFNQFAELAYRAGFKKDTTILYTADMIDDYYQTYIVGFEFDSIETRHSISFGDLREIYVFYKNGVELRQIWVTFAGDSHFIGIYDQTTAWTREPIVTYFPGFFNLDDPDE
jgi:hypothetical protein